MVNDTSTVAGALQECIDHLEDNLAAKGVTASYAPSTGMIGLIDEILNIPTGGSCYHIEFSEDSYVAVGGSATLEIMLQENYAPKSGATVTVSGSDSSLYTGITNSQGIAEVTVTNVSAETTFTATYSNATATCIVTVGSSVSSVLLTGTSNILSYYHNETCTLSATVLDSNNQGVSGETVTFYKGTTSIGTATTNASGVATKTYSSTGAGDVSFTAECSNITSSAYSVEDCFIYSATEISRTSTYNTDKYATMFSNFSFTSDSYLCELDIKYTNASTGFGVAPTGRTDPYHEIDFADSLQSNKHIQSMYTTAGTYRYDQISTNTYYTIKFTYVNGTLTVYINGTQKGSYSNLSAYNGDTREIYWYEWSSGRTTYIKNVKIKPI